MAYYVPRLYDFLTRLAANNNREWFAAHKNEYDDLRSLWLEDLQRLIDHMGRWDAALKRYNAKECAYRIYRDTRFSLDKTPYKIYFSALVSAYGRHADRACYYLQLDIRPEESGLYGGIWHPEAPVLKKLRTAITVNDEEWHDITRDAELEKYFPGWVGERLKTAPKGWPKDHLMIDILRLKDIGKWCRCGKEFFSDPSWPEIASERFRLLKPLIDFINYSIEEEV